jgi:hypothetical protein
LLSATPGVTGSGTLAVFTFEALKAGVSPIGLSGVTLLDSSLNTISSTTTGGSITIKSGGGVMAPEIDPASAASGLTLLVGSVIVLRGRRLGQ